MADKTKYNIEIDNLDLYFASKLPTMTPQAKDFLPKDLLFKLFRKGGDINSNSTSKLGFLAKMWVLWKALRTNFFIVFEGDEKNGLTIEQFCELKNAIKVRDYSVDRAKELIASGTFVSGSKDLMQTMAYLNNLSTSPAYKYLLIGKNFVSTKTEQNKDACNYIFKFLSHYEANRKDIGLKSGLNISEWMVLIYLYNGKEVVSNTLYKNIYQYSFNSSKVKIKLAISSLQQQGYIVKYGVTLGAKIQITSLGIVVCNDILDKFVINC